MRRRGGAKRSRSHFSRPLTRALFFIPALFLVIFLVVYPVVQTLILSFFVDSDFAGLDNYGAVLTDPATINPNAFSRGPPLGTLLNNFVWILIQLPVTLFGGLFLAVLLQNVRGASLVKSAVFFGMVTPLIVGGLILRFLYEAPIGIVPSFFRGIGVDALAVNWMAHPSTLLFGLIFGSIWLWTGFSLVVYSAGLTTIPRDYFEAAKVDGASGWRTFWKITWPLLRPITLVVVTMTLLWNLKLFDLVIAATNPSGGVGGAADVLALQMYRYGFVALPRQFAKAAVVATLLSIMTLTAALFMFRRILRPKRAPRRAPGRSWSRSRRGP